MPQNKFFYIICRDNQIFEIAYTTERVHGAVEALREKGIYTVQGSGLIINGADISKILDETEYDNFINTVRPNQYPKCGIWYDKKHEFVRYEKWKEEEIKNKKLIGNKIYSELHESSDEVNKMVRETVENLRQGVDINPYK